MNHSITKKHDVSMPPEKNSMILPVGKSPIHCFRILKSFKNEDFSSFIIVVSEQTRRSGEIMINLLSKELKKLYIINYNEIENCEHLKDPEIRWNIFSGPGHMSMFLKIFEQCIKSTGKYPIFWTYHREQTSRNKAKSNTGEKLFRLDNKFSLPLSKISIDKNTACVLYDLDTSIFNNSRISWDSNSVKFTYTATVPKIGLNNESRSDIRKWEEAIINESNDIKNKIGRHGILFYLKEVPDVARFHNWIVSSERFREHGFKVDHWSGGRL